MTYASSVTTAATQEYSAQPEELVADRTQSNNAINNLTNLLQRTLQSTPLFISRRKKHSKKHKKKADIEKEISGEISCGTTVNDETQLSLDDLSDSGRQLLLLSQKKSVYQTLCPTASQLQEKENEPEVSQEALKIVKHSFDTDYFPLKHKLEGQFMKTDKRIRKFNRKICKISFLLVVAAIGSFLISFFTTSHTF